MCHHAASQCDAGLAAALHRGQLDLDNPPMLGLHVRVLIAAEALDGRDIWYPYLSLCSSNGEDEEAGVIND